MPPLSKGCQCCQAGKWLCVFLTYRCEAGCSFCPAPFSDDRTWTELGLNLADVMRALDIYDYEGIGFSGGDCFLVPERLEEWLSHLHARFPRLYYWVYTNGLAASSDRMQTLARHGMNEIRFNLAGTGYRHPVVLGRIQDACRIFRHVAVEIPSIPEHYDQLVDVLPALAGYGIHYLHLHEFLLSPHDLLARKAYKETCAFNLIGALDYDIRSMENTRRVMAFCRRHKLPIAVNNCSIEQKERQMLHRRLCWARRTCQPWEKVSPEGLLETCCRKDRLDDLSLEGLDWGSIGGDVFVHPDMCEEQESYQKVCFMPPLDIQGQRVMVKGAAGC